MEKSQYLETLEKLQGALNLFDMSFGVSNKIFRFALVSEILDTVCLFEQLYDSWLEHLPFGEGPDVDVDFEYWKDLSNWGNLLDGARQNACIDDYPIDMGNGVTTDKVNGNRRKNYLKILNSVLRRSKYEGKEHASNFVKSVNSDKSHMITFGNMVYEALTPLLLVLGKIEGHLISPPEELFQDYYVQQKERFSKDIADAIKKTKDIMHEQIPERRKINRLKELRDRIVKTLRESGFLIGLMGFYNIYDADDYRHEHNCPNLSDEETLERMALEDILTDDKQLDRKKISKHIFDNRKTLSRESIASFYIYSELMPEIERLLSVLKNYDVKHEAKNESLPLTLSNSKCERQIIINQTILVKGDIVRGNKTDIATNYGPNIDNHDGGTVGLPSGAVPDSLPQSDGDKEQ